MPAAKHTFLQRVLTADAAISGATGLLMLGAAGALETLLGLPAPLFRWAGVALLPFAAGVLALARRRAAAPGGVRVVIALNAAWVAASLLLLAVPGLRPTVLGYAFVLAQAIAVAGFGEMQWVGLRRSAA